MNRRNKDAISGFVNFPVDKFPSTGEGGMFVRLVVIPNNDDENEFMQCCGGYQVVLFDETLIEDDETCKIPEPEEPDYDNASREELVDYITATTQRMNLVYDKHFPRWNEQSFDDFKIDKYMSIEYLAIITIGSTGWSNADWVCTYEDLTEDGKKLYNMISKLYEGTGKVCLQTWLDT